MNWLFAPEEPGPAFWQAFAGWRMSFAEIGNEAARPPQAAVDGRVAD